MKFVSTIVVSALAVATAASPVGKLDVDGISTQQKELHPTNFPNIQAAHAFHDLLKEIYPLINNAAELAGVSMKDLLDGTPFDWDAQFASSAGEIQRRGFLDAVPLMAEASKTLLGFISRVAQYAHQDMISNIAETLADYMS
ncbi:hypothetical protein JCM33374_g2309 [Metschnikowia sp. JCM 33374]|nr:hypothetical protein JCM33374_g2309 [Metschnikowia sp. JCM 33374]